MRARFTDVESGAGGAAPEMETLAMAVPLY